MTTSTSSHDDQRVKLADLAIGSTDLADDQSLAAHLKSCAACTRELVALEQIAAAIDVAAATDLPPEDLEDAVIATMLRATDSVPQRATKAAPRTSALRLRWNSLRGMRIAIAVPTFALAVVCVFLVSSLNNQQDKAENLQVKLDKLEGKPSLDVLNGASIKSLDTDAPFEDARVQMALTKDGGVISLRNVPTPPKDRAWQVWQVDKDKNIRSIGVISEGRELIFLDLDDIDGKDLERIIITSEPAEGSDAPSSTDVARSSI